MKNSIRLLPVLSLAVPAALSAAMSDFTALPPTQVPGTDPNVMINLSIETPMQGAAYNDQNDGGTCTGRPASEGGKNIGACYFKDQEYIGYFDPDKCYVYSTDHFAPSGAVGTDHECSGKWSGNMLNWATMTAIDEFRWALTGGHRSTDTATETRLQRANMGLSAGHSWFPVKKLQNPLNTNPNKVTPYNNSVLYITSTGTTINVGTTAGASDVASGLNVIVKVCDSTQGLEENCNAYGSNYKPEGLIQNNARNMRFAVMSYLNNADKNRHGGVLRANMKYVGPEMPATGGGFQTNANREWDAGSGVFVVNPDPTDAAASSVTNSGVINYINKFGANGYKSYDPIGELFYECLNYFRDKGPTSAFYSGATATEKDGFPVITNWIDPIQYSCQPNYIVGINDANPWLDKWLPGTSVVTGATYNNFSWSGNESAAPPSDTIDVTDLTNTVGELQGLNGTTFSIGCVPGNCDMVANNKLVNNLGEVFGTAPWAGKENSYYIAGLAYWGASQDIRTSADSNNIDGRQSIRTFMIDTQEYNANPLTGQTNMLWLAAKYGGFEESDKTDTNSDGNNYEPNLTAEWDADGDGEPDNYVLATNPQKLVSGLSRALSDIADRVSSGGAASVVSNDANGNSVMVRAYYQPMLNDNGSTVEWVGKLQAIFRDDFGNLREDSNGNKKLDDYATDFVIQTFFDETVTPNRARVQRMNTTDGINMTPTGTPIELEDLKVLWDSQDRLSDPTVDMKVQRAYTTNSSKQRHIFTWFDNNTDGSVDSGEITDFTSANISASNWTWLNTADETTAESIVDFIRGDEGNSAFRNRTIDNNNNGVTDSGDVVWRLGDVIDSSPVVVGPPSNPNIERLDSTYTDYRVAYQNRRMVAYVGANDGMVHAFNMGFLKTADTSFVQ